MALSLRSWVIPCRNKLSNSIGNHFYLVALSCDASNTKSKIHHHIYNTLFSCWSRIMCMPPTWMCKKGRGRTDYLLAVHVSGDAQDSVGCHAMRTHSLTQGHAGNYVRLRSMNLVRNICSILGTRTTASLDPITFQKGLGGTQSGKIEMKKTWCRQNRLH